MTRPVERRLQLAIGTAVAAVASAAAAADWPRFRGPNGTGVSSDVGLPPEISRDKNVAWSVKVPKGSSSPIVVGGRVFLTGHHGERRIVLCHDSATGEPLWRRSLDRARGEPFHPAHGPTTPTPATDGRNVFVFFPDVGLLGYTRDGQELWRTPLDRDDAVRLRSPWPVRPILG